MILTQEAPLTRKWFLGRSCIRSNWTKLGVNFEEGGNRSAWRKPSKPGWDRLKLDPHTTFVVEVEGVIDVHYANLTSQGVQYRVFHRDGHPYRYQPRPTGLNFGKQKGTGVFPLVIAVPLLLWVSLALCQKPQLAPQSNTACCASSHICKRLQEREVTSQVAF